MISNKYDGCSNYYKALKPTSFYFQNNRKQLSCQVFFVNSGKFLENLQNLFIIVVFRLESQI